jgi:hypothetical protein
MRTLIELMCALILFTRALNELMHAMNQLMRALIQLKCTSNSTEE